MTKPVVRTTGGPKYGGGPAGPTLAGTRTFNAPSKAAFSGQYSWSWSAVQTWVGSKGKGLAAPAPFAALRFGLLFNSAGVKPLTVGVPGNGTNLGPPPGGGGFRALG